MQEVTDPELLAQLNGNSSIREHNEVTDPELLAQLNSKSGKAIERPEQTWRDKLNAIPDDVITGVKGGVQNLFHGVAPSLVSEFHPQGISQHIGDFLGNVGAFAGGGEALGALGKGIPIVRNVIAAGSKLPGWMKRLGGATTYGAINNPEDREKGATVGLTIGGAGEGLGALLGKGLPKAAEFLYPKKFANDLASDINKGYKKAQEDSNKLYDTVTDKLGKENIENKYNYGHPSPKYNTKSQYLKLDRDEFKDYPSDLRKVNDKFLDEPNFKNAHKLQSKIGSTAADYLRKNDDLDKIQNLKNKRSILKEDINNFLKVRSPEDYQQYKNATKFYKDNVVPYENPVISGVSTKNTETITPEALKNSLQKLSELKRDNNSESYLLPKNHYLRQALEELSHRMDRGTAAATTGSLGLGATLGHMLYGAPGAILGGAAGGGVGFLGRRYLAPHILDLATNNYVNKTLPKFKTPYDLLVKSLIKSQTGNS